MLAEREDCADLVEHLENEAPVKASKVHKILRTNGNLLGSSIDFLPQSKILFSKETNIARPHAAKIATTSSTAELLLRRKSPTPEEMK